MLTSKHCVAIAILCVNFGTIFGFYLPGMAPVNYCPDAVKSDSCKVIAYIYKLGSTEVSYSNWLGSTGVSGSKSVFRAVVEVITGSHTQLCTYVEDWALSGFGTVSDRGLGNFPRRRV